MAREVRSFQVTIPAGTAKAANFSAAMSMPDREVVELEVRVPPGPRGEMGFAIGAAGVPILPYQAGAFIITDDERINWPLEEQITSGAWQLFGYNTGDFDHTVYVRFLLNVPGQSVAQAGSAPISSQDLGSGVLNGGTGTLPFPLGPPDQGPPIAPLPPTAPLTLTPSPPPLPGEATGPAAGFPEDLVLAQQDSGQFWLLAQGRLVQVQQQQDLDAFQQAAFGVASITTATQAQLLSAERWGRI